MRRLHKEDGNDCESNIAYAIERSGAEVCVWFNLEYPKVVSAPNEAARAKITKQIDDWVLEEECEPGGYG
jgi:hypothetical protein